MQRLTKRLLMSCLIVIAAHGARAGNLDIPAEKLGGEKPAEMMRRCLLRQVDGAIKKWKADYEKCKSPEEIAARQKRLREYVLKAIGGLPERSPLKPQVTGAISKPGYRIEKILFQSQPDHYVSGLLFLPDPERFKPPYAGVLVPGGHSPNGKAYKMYQSMGALLALSGMVGLVFDPIDQGERGQYLGEGGWPELSSVSGHIMIGMGSILLGQNTARFEIWDGMRAIDYLQSRPEVDPKRIGCTGCSGGGTQTSYLMALDDRIQAAAPSCYLTSMSTLLHAIGPQDSEQHFFGQLAVGMDHADWVILRAPLPVLILAATQDAFPIDGTWDTFRYAKRLYTRMGFAERVDLVEADAVHSFGVLHHEGAARWMSRWLLGKEQVIVEPEIELLSDEECWCAPKGLVMSIPDARSVYDLNEDAELALAERRKTAWAEGDRAALLGQVRRLAGVRHLADLPKPQVESVETIAREGYAIEKLVFSPEEGVWLPALLFLPEKPRQGRATLYLDAQGKAAGAAPGGPIERLVLAGAPVLAVDLRGMGQTQAATNDKGYSDEFRDAYKAYLLGKSYVGMRAEDVLVCARWAAHRFAAGQKAAAVRLIALGNVGVPGLHAAALEPDVFQSVELSGMLVSWSNVIHNRLNRHLVTHLVHGALEHYDLPDLATVVGEKLTVDRPVNAVGAPIEDMQ